MRLRDVMAGAALLLVVSGLLGPGGLQAQRALAALPAAVAQPASGSSAFLIEAAGGIAGSLVGFGAIYLMREGCGDDLACTIRRAGAAMALGAAGATAGTYFAGKSADTEPSVLGAALGAVAGAAAGVGLWHLFTEELDIGNERGMAIVSFSVTQGIFTALGSRLGSSMR